MVKVERKKTVHVKQSPLSSGAEPEGSLIPGGGQQDAPLSMFDRFGGIDGIVSIFGKISQLVGMFRQISPLFKLFGSFMGPKASVSSFSGHERRKPAVRSPIRPGTPTCPRTRPHVRTHTKQGSPTKRAPKKK